MLQPDPILMVIEMSAIVACNSGRQAPEYHSTCGYQRQDQSQYREHHPS
jgi:hypothetical protein